MTGDAGTLTPADRETLAREALPAIYVNHLLPSDARVLFLGEAAPLYYRHGRYDYHTVWDRGPMSGILERHADAPQRWLAALRERGYTHVLINPTMLRIWQRAGWNDPRLTADELLTFADANLIREHAWPTGERLYRIP